MMFDKIEKISKSLIQHGPNNDRIYLMKVHPEEHVEKLIDELHDLAILKRYTKIFVKVPESIHQLFLNHNFKLEATIPNLFHGTEQGCFLGKYFNAEREFITKKEKKQIDEVRESVIPSNNFSADELTPEYKILKLDEIDISTIASIYRKVFRFYPFPIFQEKYLLDSMRSNVRYFGAFHKDKVIAISSAEMDKLYNNVEMTDFATLPDYRGRNLSYYLLQTMLSGMAVEGIQTAYTIARAASYGMNKTFARHGFHFGGTLINNTLIGDTIESMNVWYKQL